MGERKPKVLRWFVLWVVFTALGGVWFLVSTPLMAAFKISGAQTTDFETTTTVVVDEGDYFGLMNRATKPVVCEVAPRDGEVRDVGAPEPSFSRRSRQPVVTPWFTGEATITCDGPATLMHPGFYSSADVGSNVLMGLMGAGGVCFAIGAVQFWRLRRTAAKSRGTASAFGAPK